MVYAQQLTHALRSRASASSRGLEYVFFDANGAAMQQRAVRTVDGDEWCDMYVRGTYVYQPRCEVSILALIYTLMLYILVCRCVVPFFSFFDI